MTIESLGPLRFRERDSKFESGSLQRGVVQTDGPVCQSQRTSQPNVDPAHPVNARCRILRYIAADGFLLRVGSM
jgi:hypothetical protein